MIGLGYVGLPLALLCAKAGFKATGFDIDPRKTEKLDAGESYIHHIPAASIADAVKKEAVSTPRPTSPASRIWTRFIICVPTPLDKHREPDMSFVLDTAEMVGKHLQTGQLMVLESTTYPGTTDEEMLADSREGGSEVSGLRLFHRRHHVTASGVAEPDFFLAFSPEREDPGNKNFQTQQVPKIVGGVNASSA